MRRSPRSDRVPVDDLLDAAGVAFERWGVAQATMVDVARLAGCSRATLYRHFPSREALRLAYVHRATLRIAAEIAPDYIPGDPESMVDLFMRGIAAVRSDPLLAVWFEPQNIAIPLALSQSSELLAAMTVGRAAEFAGDHGDVEAIELRGAWLLRCIVSLLAMPGPSEEAERISLAEFVVPLLLDGSHLTESSP